jgi:hypothetical protein
MMLTVEYLIEKLNQLSYTSSKFYYDRGVINSFHAQLQKNSGLTEKQAAYALKIIKKYQKILSETTNKDISTFLNNPVYQTTPRKPLTTKKISIVSLDKNNDEYELRNISGKAIKVEFPYNEELKLKIKNFRFGKNSPNALAEFTQFWDSQERAWIFPLCESAVVFLKDFVEKENFEVDEEFENYLQQVKHIIDNLENYVPSLVYDETQGLCYKNVLKSVPKLESTDFLSAIFEARRRGILVWDNTVDNFIKNYENSVVRDFLQQSPDKLFVVDSKKTEIFLLCEIVKHLTPVIFLIPEGRALENISRACDLIKASGIDNDEISVLFRLPSNTDKEFNDFIKNNNLNNPVDKNTKVVFLNDKIPKPMIKADIKFNAVISVDCEISYKFQQRYENLIVYSKNSSSRDQNLWQLLEL